MPHLKLKNHLYAQGIKSSWPRRSGLKAITMSTASLRVRTPAGVYKAECQSSHQRSQGPTYRIGVIPLTHQDDNSRECTGGSMQDAPKVVSKTPPLDDA